MRVIDQEYDSKMNPVSVICEDDGDTYEFEIVKHGWWEWYEDECTSIAPDADYGWRCSNCKEDLEMMLIAGIPNTGMYVNLDDGNKPPTLRRCPKCGAIMEV